MPKDNKLTKIITENNLVIFLGLYPIVSIIALYSNYSRLIFLIISIIILNFLFFYLIGKIILVQKTIKRIKEVTIIFMIAHLGIIIMSFFILQPLPSFKWNMLFYIFFLYFIILLPFFSKIHLMYYFFYRKILSILFKRISTVLNKIYNVSLELGSFLLIISLFILFFHSLNFYDFKNIIILNSINNFDIYIYSNINHLIFKESLLYLIGSILGLLIIKYFKYFYILLHKIFFRWSIVPIFISIFLIYNYIFEHNIIIQQYLNINILAYIFIGVIYIYLFLYITDNSKKIEFEGKNKLFKKFFIEQNIKERDIIGYIISFLKLKINNDNNNYLKIGYEELNKTFNDFRKYIEIERNYLSLLDDTPFTLGKTDILGIDNFSKNIAELIDGILLNEKNRSFSIGIVGEWGLGKSSVINLLKEKHIDGYPQYEIMNFNPWNFEKKELILNFFNDLSITVGLNGFDSIINEYLNALGEIDNKLKIFKLFKKKERIEDIKTKLNNKLEELKNKKIIIIIDDLDRCDHKEVMTVLNIIKNLGDLNNIIYVVSYDKNNIISILKKEGYDKNYLDKIINVERYLPLNTKEQLKDYFKLELSEIFKIILDKDNKLKQIAENVVDISLIEIDLSLPLVKQFTINVFSKIKVGFFGSNINNKNIKAINDENINKDTLEIVDILVKRFEYIYERENLRFMKKFLNQLNIIFNINFHKIENIEIIDKFNYIDYTNILLINYVKLKDYEWFIKIMNLRFDNFKGETYRKELDFSADDMPEYLEALYNKQENINKAKFIELLFNVYETTKSEKDPNNDSISTIYTTGLNLTPATINTNIRLILEKFN